MTRALVAAPLTLAALLVAASARAAPDPDPPAGPDPGAVAVALRSHDPEVREAGRLARYVLRTVLDPSLDPSTDAPPEAAAVLAGWSRGADRRLLPEFDSARAAEGRSIREHLLNAIYMNASRMGWYSQRAGGFAARLRARLLSRYMIVGEAVAIVGMAAGRFDARAREARARWGTDVLVGDLVPLRPLPVQTPPHFRGVATAAQRRAVRDVVERLDADVHAALERGDLRGVAERCRGALARVVACEEAWGCHFQMTRHTIGSIGYAALRGDAHARVAPATRALSLDYIRTTVGSTFGYGQAVDRLAQPLQARGLGFVVNEFTDQAFTDLWAAEVVGAAQRVARVGPEGPGP